MKNSAQNKITFPAELLDQGRQYVHDADAAKWALGDLCALICFEFCPPFKKTYILQKFADQIGSEYGTLHKAEWLSNKIPAELRDDFPALSRAQWEACCLLKDDFLDLATWALEQADTYGGNPAPSRVIRREAYRRLEKRYNEEQTTMRLIETLQVLSRETCYPERAMVARISAHLLSINGSEARLDRQTRAIARALDAVQGAT